MDRDTPWTRRSSKPSLERRESSKTEAQSKNASTSKRYTSADVSSSSSGRSNPFNGITPLNTNTTASPGASSAFGLGSGAFAAFGSSSKTPKTPGGALDFNKPTSSSASPPPDSESVRSVNKPLSRQESGDQPTTIQESKSWPLKYTWVMWYRPPTSKNQDYEKSIKPIYKMSTAQEFWKIYSHLKRPSALPIVSDYHFFKDGIRPVWEDDENKKGGKWIIRFKKGVMDRYWDDILLAIIGDQFAEAGEEVCGIVVSVRNGEDVLSVWTKIDGGRNVKIRETIKRILNLPSDTVIVWKSHDDSIAQRSAIDQARQEKGGSDKRRSTLNENNASSKDKEKQPA